MCTLNEQQRQQVYLNCNCIPLQRLAELCLNPSSGITIEGLREAGCNRIDQLAALCQHKDSGQRHPNNGKQNKAEEYIRNQKCLLEDMKRNPSDYHRETMHEIITTNMLSREDLVDKYAVLTDRAYEHIKRYPHLNDEQRPLPISRVENPHIKDGSLDVIFWGLPGTGITCLLSGLLGLKGQLGFNFDYPGLSCGGKLAMELRNYSRSSMLPPHIKDAYIQVIETQLSDENGFPRTISLIKMPGEKLSDFSLMDRPMCWDDFGPGAVKLLSNDNKKALFFVIDPSNEKKMVLDNGRPIATKQSDVFKSVLSVLQTSNKIMRRIDVIYFILTKVDTLGDVVDQNIIQERLNKQGYTECIKYTKDICLKYGINRQVGCGVGLYPFSLGKFMPGDVYEYDETYSLKILRSLIASPILPCVYGPPPSMGLIGKFINWLNS